MQLSLSVQATVAKIMLIGRASTQCHLDLPSIYITCTEPYPLGKCIMIIIQPGHLQLGEK